MPKILMIVRNLPPAHTVSAVRPSKFIKYLPEFGWEPYVITYSKNPDYGIDNSLLPDIKKARLYRVPPLVFLRKTCAAVMRGLRSVGINLENELGADIDFSWITSSLMQFIRLSGTVKPDIVWVTSVPNSTFLIVPLLKKISRAPIVIDFHNMWKLPAVSTPNATCSGRATEERVISSAAGAVVLNKCHFQALAGRVKVPVELIENGFDTDAPIPEVAIGRGEKLHIVYTGAIYPGTDPEPFFRVLDKCVRDGIVPKEQIRVSVYPFFSSPDPSKYGFEMQVFEPVGRDKIGEVYRSATILLIVYQSPQTPTRIYEATASGVPVLACVDPASRTAEITRESNCGIVCSVFDEHDMNRGIREVYERWKTRNLQFRLNTEFIAQFARRRLTEKLSNFLYSVLLSSHS